MLLFWARGAEEASYDDIVRTTGLSRRALYAAWPEKDALVHVAIARYRETVLRPLVALLDAGGRKGLERFWDGLERGVRSPGWVGCFLFRSASGAFRGDPVVVRHFEEHITLLTTAIVRSIREASAAGEIVSGIQPEHAGLESAAVIGLASTLGAQSGYSKRVQALIDAGRSTCGLPRPKAGRTRAVPA